MPSLPQKDQQILHAHAGLIHRVVVACQNPALVPDLDDILAIAEKNEWHALVAAIRRILAGEREIGRLPGLDEEDKVIVGAILRGIQNPDTLPDLNADFDSSLAAPGIASLIHAARTGNTEALQMIANMAQQMLKAGGDMARLAAIIRPLVTGERDVDKLAEGFSDKGRELVADIVRELQRLEMH